MSKAQKQQAAATKSKLAVLPEPSETLCDFLQSVTFDGLLFRVDFGVNRYSYNVTTGPAQLDKQLISARLALTPAAAFKLHEILGQILTQLEKQGTIKKTQPAPKTIQ